MKQRYQRSGNIVAEWMVSQVNNRKDIPDASPHAFEFFLSLCTDLVNEELLPAEVLKAYRELDETAKLECVASAALVSAIVVEREGA